MFRSGSNHLVLLFFFFIAGFLLHYQGRPKPLADMWAQFRSFAGIAHDVGSDPPPVQTYVLPDEAPADLGQITEKPDFPLPARKRNDQVVRHKGFTLSYAEPYEQAEWVAYKLTRGQVTGQSTRARLFLPDPKVKTGSAVFADYTRSGYDRGHLAPAADFKHDYAAMEETFYMSNISPQHKAFNAGIWNDLEKLTRIWAQRHERVFVVTGPVLKPGLPTIGRVNRVAVPEHFYKVVLLVQPPHVRGIAFVLPNQPSGEPLSTFAVTIDAVEKLTGLDFFPLLPDNIEKEVEASCRPKDWYRLR